MKRMIKITNTSLWFLLAALGAYMSAHWEYIEIGLTGHGKVSWLIAPLFVLPAVTSSILCSVLLGITLAFPRFLKSGKATYPAAFPYVLMLSSTFLQLMALVCGYMLYWTQKITMFWEHPNSFFYVVSNDVPLYIKNTHGCIEMIGVWGPVAIFTAAGFACIYIFYLRDYVGKLPLRFCASCQDQTPHETFVRAHGQGQQKKYVCHECGEETIEGLPEDPRLQTCGFNGQGI